MCCPSSWVFLCFLVSTIMLWSMSLIHHRSTVWWRSDVELAQYAFFSCLSLLSLLPSFIDCLADWVSLFSGQTGIFFFLLQVWGCKATIILCCPNKLSDTTTHICSCCLYGALCQDTSTQNLSKQLKTNPTHWDENGLWMTKIALHLNSVCAAATLWKYSTLKPQSAHQTSEPPGQTAQWW